ncbi:hypothetical protein OAM99_04790 [Planktomarina sp.]|nr:hypothetical protein [Planktomarina sp.]
MVNRKPLNYRMAPELLGGLYIALISFIMLLLINGIPIPKDSHYFVSRLPFYPGNDEQIVNIFGLLRAPVYELIDWVFWNPLTYACATFLGIFLLSYSLFFCALRMGKNFLFSFLGSLLVLPFSSQLTVLPFIGDFFSVSFPIHFGYQLDGFTTRMLTGFLFCCIIYALHFRHYNQAIIILFLCFLCHPNNAISIAIVIFFTFLFLGITKRIHLFKNLIYLVIVICLGLVPAVLKMQELEPISVDVFNAYDWYQGLLYDEGDDFSALFYLQFHFVGQIQAIFIPLIIVFISKQLETKGDDFSTLYALALSPVFAYLFFALFEFSANKLELWNLMGLLIPTQLGMKVIELSYLPTVFLVIITMSRMVDRKNICA